MWPRIARAATQLAVAGFIAVLALSFVPAYPCSLLEHFRVQLAIGGIFVAGAAAGFARRGWLDAALIALLFDACLVVPDLGSSRRAIPESGVALRVLLLNVERVSTGYEAVARLIADEQPDVIALVEPDSRWLAALAPALASYGSRIEHPRSDNFGIAIYARGRLVAGVEQLGTDLPSIVGELDLDGVRLGVVVTHPVPPMSSWLLDDQSRQFDAIAQRVRGFGHPFLVMGDFNATPWSRAFVRLRGATGTCDTRAGFGAQTSFPAGSWLLRISIDHALVSCSIGVRDRRIGPDVGSDHLPVIVDLVVPRH